MSIFLLHIPYSAEQVSPAAVSAVFRDGETVRFRVLNEVEPGVYLISLKNYRVTVKSFLVLEVGRSYLAEVLEGIGEMILRIKPGQGEYETLAFYLRSLRGDQNVLSGLLRQIISQTAGEHPLTGFTGRPAALASALKDSGIFYESKLRDWFLKGEPVAVDRDLKGYLMRLATQYQGGLKETIDTALRNIELQDRKSVV
jgi:hypothetical protein